MRKVTTETPLAEIHLKMMLLETGSLIFDEARMVSRDIGVGVGIAICLPTLHTRIDSAKHPVISIVGVAVSRGYDTCFTVKACDGLYQLIKSMGLD